MLLRVDVNRYFHDTGEALDGSNQFPYPEITFEKTTWGTWRKSRPNADIVTEL